MRVPHLASHLLALVARRINADWQQKYETRPGLAGELCGAGTFRGTCYQAANWRCVGQTRRRSRYDRDRTLSVPPKAVYLYRLKMKVLLEVEAQTLAQGREWTRQRLEQRLQAQADQIEAVCPQAVLVLKLRLREFSLMTCAGTVTVRAA